MSISILIDMNLGRSWQAYLQERGFDAVHWSEIGHANDPDDVILEYAAEHDRVLLTVDLDFGDILAATGRKKPSVVQLRTQSTLVSSIGPQIGQALSDHAAALEAGALVVVDLRRLRVRLLPLAEH